MRWRKGDFPGAAGAGLWTDRAKIQQRAGDVPPYQKYGFNFPQFYSYRLRNESFLLLPNHEAGMVFELGYSTDEAH